MSFTPALSRIALALSVIGVMPQGARADDPGAANRIVARERHNFDAGWRFAFGHPFDPARDFNHGVGYFSYFAKAGYGDGQEAQPGQSLDTVQLFEKVGQDGGYVCSLSDHFFDTPPGNIGIFAEAAKECTY